MWLETKFEEELLKLFSLPALEFSCNLNSSASPSSVSSWHMVRQSDERMYKDKWKKRYFVYSTDMDLVSDNFNFHMRLKGTGGEYAKLPFMSPDKMSSSPLSSYSNYLSLLGGARIDVRDDHYGYPPGEHAAEDGCCIYEGSDVCFVVVGQIVGSNYNPADTSQLANTMNLTSNFGVNLLDSSSGDDNTGSSSGGGGGGSYSLPTFGAIDMMI